ncbi:MAG TPA: HIRAN domain-containing protein [Kofleriaceae bacterium]|nr:HIRAN domain-containing protein [Kofleriaceae bacterium]
MAALDRLLVIWGEPKAGNRRVIGHLARLRNGQFHFWYEDDLAEAQARGFKLLPQFPAHRHADAPYSERYLFPLFAERIPAPTRLDAQTMMRGWGVTHPDDQFEVLAKSGGIRATDRIELAEYRAPDDDLTHPLELRIAGRRHIQDPASITVGDTLFLRPEPENPSDPGAVVIEHESQRAGYVPRQYTALIGSLLDRGESLTARVVRQLIVPEDVGKWVVAVSRAS